ncbi:DNA polymerase III subunit alpha [Candidatus Gracilibacteria bacterium]|nr:DNA polymerase III subunit alpha [Candidatus Gracilibacteria bacterium]MCF7898580.1 DNA polymerase III subunit alpha [Candidatus Paceibacterota bacterium]
MFIHLRNHTHYSLLKALPKVDELVKHASSVQMPAVAITDYSNMYGVIEFYKTCKKANIKPIIGVEFSIRYNDRTFQIILIARTFSGYKNLMHITSCVNVDNPLSPTLTDEILLRYRDGITVLSGGLWGDVSNLLVINKQEAMSRISFYKENFGAFFYLEVNPQTSMEYSERMRSETISCAHETNTPLVATWNTHYIHPSDKSAHKTLFMIQGGESSLGEYNHLFQKDSFSFVDEKDAVIQFKDVPEALLNTIKISDSCDVDIPLGSWVFPNIEYKKSYDEDVRDLAYEGLKVRKMELTDIVKTRLEYELKVISDKGYSPYFLVVYDLLRYARENNILTNIRGSVAGSLITYLLRITKCDPLAYKLPFERFLNPERPSAPDIDMDYADIRRDEVLDYVRSKYGIDNVAQIGTFGTMMARGAVRDVARAMKYPYIVGDRISKMIPPPKQGFPVTIAGALRDVPELKAMYDADRETQTILDMAQKIEGCARHISVHAAGTVISPLPLWEFSPIQKDPKGGKVITQYDMYTVEDAGLLKFDFLGIRNLTILGDAIKIAKERYKVYVDIEEIPLDDMKTFDMLSRGETVGLFQLNGSGMTRFLKELKPSTIFDINAMVALYRPGPLEMIPDYIARKHNPSLITFLDPRLEPILDQSFGVIVYQDDVMLIAIHLAGYSWLEADKLRKAMGKKIPAEMQAQKEKLLLGFVEHGLSAKKGQLLWSLIEPFAAYGFNKAHAASYGRVAYQTAYMKANFPVAYMTAIMTNESGDVDKISEIVAECKRMKIIVLPPDINMSDGGFSVVKDKDGKEEIRFGLYTVKNLGVDISDAIIEERKINGKYTSFEDFIRRVTHKNLNKKSLEALTKCGALDEFRERGEILANIESILDFHKHVVKDNILQHSLFGESESPSFVMKKAEPISQEQKLVWEKDLLGLFVSGFPLDPWKEKIDARNIDIDKVHHNIPDGKEVSLAVIIENIKITVTKKGDKMALMRLRDYTGTIEVAVFPETYKRQKDLVTIDTPLIASGKVSTRNGEKTIIVNELKRLSTT